jgi:hypothetical protein
MQGTKPQTLAYGLTAPPVGLAAWIVETFRAWGDYRGDIERGFTKDELQFSCSGLIGPTGPVYTRPTTNPPQRHRFTAEITGTVMAA